MTESESKSENKNDYENEINETIHSIDMSLMKNEAEVFKMPYENNEYTKYNPLHKELGITLIRVPDTVKYDDLEEYIKNELDKREIFYFK